MTVPPDRGMGAADMCDSAWLGWSAAAGADLRSAQAPGAGMQTAAAATPVRGKGTVAGLAIKGY